MVGDIFPSRLQDPKRVSDCEVGTIKSSGTEDAQEIGSRPSQQTLSVSFSLDATPEGPEGLEYGTDANGSAGALSGSLARLPGDPPNTVCISASESLPEKSTKFLLPGGGVPAERCGDRIPKHCKTHDGEFWGRSHCNERSCPRCFERWAALEAQSASLRISWGAKYWQLRMQRVAVHAKEAGYSPLDPIWMFKRVLLGHFVVSMPDNLSLWVHDWSERKARAMVYKICRAHGVSGGAVIFHPWRRDDDLQEYVPDGYWHFHILGAHLMPTTPGGSDVGPDGRIIVFKHIRDDEYGNFGGVRSGLAIARLLHYQLTHGGLQEGKHALTYFGLLAYNKLPESEIHSTYPECLEDDSKTNPPMPVLCPVDGSSETESCIRTIHLYDELPSAADPSVMQPRKWLGTIEDVQHPDPVHLPSPETVEEAERVLEEQFQNLYDTEPDPAARHALTKERQRERAKLARRELELFNVNDPLVAMWVWLRGILENGSVLREDLMSESPEVLDRVIELNLRTGRLCKTLGGRLHLKREYKLDDALRDLRDLVLRDEPKDGRDWRLERLLEKNPDKVNPIMMDHGFVFDEVPWPEHTLKIVEKTLAFCCVCGAAVGEFVIDQDDDLGLSLPNIWCDSCKQRSLLERGLIESPASLLPNDQDAACEDSEDCHADRWRSSSPFSGGLE